jgi:phospholipase/carboxylesterase
MLAFRERSADGEAAGLLILHHGRGTDERDLLPLGDALDPTRRLHVVAPRAPLTLDGSPGRHWYLVPRVGYPDPATFAAAWSALAELHDELWRTTGLGPASTILGGFSMGTVMSYALALDGRRPAPSAILAFSGFIPSVNGWRADLADRTGTRVFIAHGRRDPVIAVDFARRAHAELVQGGLSVDYHESDAGHQIDPAQLPAAAAWLASVPSAAGSGAR